MWIDRQPSRPTTAPIEDTFRRPTPPFLFVRQMRSELRRVSNSDKLQLAHLTSILG